MKRNRYKLLEGVWYRWEGTKAEGTQVLYTREEGHNLINNVTPMELLALKHKIKLVAGTAPLDNLHGDVIEPLDGEVEDLTAKVTKNKPATVAMPKPKPAPLEDEPENNTEEVEADKEITIEELLDQPIGDVVSTVKTITDVANLKAIKSAEKKGKDRKGVIAAIDNQLEAVKE